MSETAALEQSAQTVEPPQVAEPVVETSPPASQMEIATQLTMARVAHDHVEAARLEGLLTETKATEVQAKETAAVDETAKAEADKAAADAKAAELEQQADESGDLPTPKQPNRFRFSEPEDQAIALIAKSKKIPLAQAAKIYEGQQPAKVEQAEVQTDTQIADPTITALEAEVAEVERQMDEAGASEGLFTPEISKLTQALSRANSKLEASRQAAKTIADVRAISQQERAQQSEAQIKQAWDASKAEVAKAFPDMSDPESPMTLVANGIALKMQDPKHPDHAELFKPSAPEFVARKAAEKLKLTAKVETTAAPAKTDAPVARPAPGSRASSVPAPQQTAEQLIAAAREKATRSIVGGHYRSQSLQGTIIL